MHQYKGKLIIHTGSMFSGKTSSLERDIKRFTIAGYKTMVFKPVLDNRYSDTKIVTHDKTEMEAVLIKDIEEIESYYIEIKPEVIGIDEIQFLEGNIQEILKTINFFLEKGVTVIVAGLDMDFTGNPFELMKELMPIAEYLYKHQAVCVRCGTDAWVSNRKIKDSKRIVLGAIEEYEPLCRRCFYDARGEKE